MWHAPPVTEDMLREITEEIVCEIDPEQVILFGSRARGTAGTESDVDLLIVERRPFGPDRSRREELARLWRRLGRYSIPIDLLLFSHAEVERWRDSLNHVIALALREGRVLHARP